MKSTKEVILCDSEGRYWLQVSIDKVLKTSYLGKLSSDAVERFALQRGMVVVDLLSTGVRKRVVGQSGA